MNPQEAAKEHEAGYKLPGLTTRTKDACTNCFIQRIFHGMNPKRSFD